MRIMNDLRYIKEPLKLSYLFGSEFDKTLNLFNGITITEDMVTEESVDGCSGVNKSIYLNGTRFILKDCEYSHNRKQNTITPLCEYVASRFMTYFTGNCQQVWLCKYNNCVAVLCKDITDGWKLEPFKDVHQSSIGTDLDGKEYTYTDVLYVIDKHFKLQEPYKEQALIQFWKMFIGDAILGNRDRHAGNWGFLKKGNCVKIAPIFDNGGSLFPNINFDNDIDYDFLYYRTYKLPGSQFLKWKEGITDRPMRTNYFEVIQEYRNVEIFSNILFECANIDIQEAINYAVSGLTEEFSLWFKIIVYCRFNCLVCNRNFDEVYKEVFDIYVK